DSVSAMVRTTVDRFGALDVLHANAGAPQRPMPFEEIPIELWQRVIAVNLTGGFLCARAVAPELRRRGGGSIVFTSSIASVRPRVGLTAYIASKAGIDGLVRSLALELAPDRIRVNAVAPGPVLTQMQVDNRFSENIEESIAALVATLP